MHVSQTAKTAEAAAEAAAVVEAAAMGFEKGARAREMGKRTVAGRLQQR